MFLKSIESRPPVGMMKIAFQKLRESGHAVPGIMHLFRFKMQKNKHLIRFTECVLRGPSPLPRGLRELIGAFVSTRNNCNFCCSAHVAVAARLLGKELVDEVLLDPEKSRLDEKHKALFRYLGKLTESSSEISAQDIVCLKQVGWTDEEIYDALTVASLFKFYNTWNNGSGVPIMRATDFQHAGDRILKFGYCMDFSPMGILKVMWLGRKEVRLADLFKLLWSFWPVRQCPYPETNDASTPTNCLDSCDVPIHATTSAPPIPRT